MLLGARTLIIFIGVFRAYSCGTTMVCLEGVYIWCIWCSQVHTYTAMKVCMYGYKGCLGGVVGVYNGCYIPHGDITNTYNR